MFDERGHRMMFEAGKAWERVKAGQVRLWSEWTTVIGPGLMEARTEAMSIAKTNTPRGGGYNTVMSSLLAGYRLHDMSETARAHILKIMTNLADVEEWRAKQKNPGDLNHPSRVWLKYSQQARNVEPRDDDEEEKEKDGNDDQDGDGDHQDGDDDQEAGDDDDQAGDDDGHGQSRC